MDDVKRKKIHKICKYLIVLVFILLSYAVAQKHEPWSDEAQSFLLARDNSIAEIFSYAKLEGTFPLWFLIIKVFIILGGKYEIFYLIPIIFSSIGVAIFEFKIKAPKAIKVLLPFTYFIFYQYTIVARAYCLIFPSIMGICSIYKKRKEKPFLYCLLLFLFMTICSYTFVTAASFVLIDLIDCYKLIKNKESNEKDQRNSFLIFIINSLELILGFLILIPDKSCNFTGNGGRPFLLILFESTLGSSYAPTLIQHIATAIVFFIGIGLAIYKEKDRIKTLLFLCIMMIPAIAENMFLTCEMWHIGIVAVMFFIVFILNDMINTNYIVKIMLTIICIIQVIWTICSIDYDIKYNYSGSKDVAELLKENNYQDKVVYGFGFDITGILPYFEDNIFENQNSDKSFWIWTNSNGYHQKPSELKMKADIYVFSKFYCRGYINLINELIKDNYKLYEIDGFIFTKTYIYQTKGYIVLIKDENNKVNTNIT